jgi:hypothetical protein
MKKKLVYNILQIHNFWICVFSPSYFAVLWTVDCGLWFWFDTGLGQSESTLANKTRTCQRALYRF